MATLTAAQLQFKPGETATAYNQRIATARGDSSAELASMQKATQSYASSSKPNAGALAGRLGSTSSSPVQAPQQTTPLPQSNGYQPYNPGTSSADGYYKSLLSSMRPTGEENALYGQQTALDSQLRNLSNGQGVMNRNIADQPIEMGFITGQQRSLEDRYALQRNDVQNQQQTLASKLANLQKQRQSAIDVAKIGVDYGQYQDSRKDNAYQSNFNNQLNQNQYSQGVAQQGIENGLNQQKITASMTPKAVTPKSTTPQYSPTKSGGGFDPLSAKYNDVVAKVQQVFPSDPYKTDQLSTKIISSLTQEQLRLFLNDFLATVDGYDQGLNDFPDPMRYFTQWAQAAGVKSGTATSGRTL